MLYTGLLHLRQKGKLVADKVLGIHFEPGKDIVLVTGGSGGLGSEIILLLQPKCKVVSLDIYLPADDKRIEGVHYYQCDVGNKTDVFEAHEKIKQEVGIVTVLINNAGITSGKKLVDMTCEEIDKIISVNLCSSFYTIKAFLPDMLSIKRGYIVTIGSTLGYMSPAHLSVYGATKAGLIALHESLTYELGSPAFSSSGIKTLLICPGQMTTNMFKTVATPSKLLAPELDAKSVANKLVAAIALGQRGEIKIPLYGTVLPIFRALPWPLVAVFRQFSGIDRTMHTFKNDMSGVVVSCSASLAGLLTSATSRSSVTPADSPMNSHTASDSPCFSDQTTQAHDT